MEMSFKNYIWEQLQDLGAVRARAMFGGYGLYQGEKFFGIISDGRLFFKTNEKTRQRYIEYRSQPFAPSREQVLKNYYEVPAEIIEDRSLLTEWAREAASMK